MDETITSEDLTLLADLAALGKIFRDKGPDLADALARCRRRGWLLPDPTDPAAMGALATALGPFLAAGTGVLGSKDAGDYAGGLQALNAVGISLNTPDAGGTSPLGRIVALAN